jgi:hypothetical protein
MRRTTAGEETVQDTKCDCTSKISGCEHEEHYPSGYDGAWDHHCTPSVCELIVVALIHTVKRPNGVAQKVWDRPSEYRRSVHDGDLVRV